MGFGHPWSDVAWVSLERWGRWGQWGLGVNLHQEFAGDLGCFLVPAARSLAGQAPVLCCLIGIRRENCRY